MPIPEWETPSMRRQMLWMLARHIQERMGQKSGGLKRYAKVVRG